MVNLQGLTTEVSQDTELKSAFQRNGWDNEAIKRLSEGNTLTDFLKVIKGQAKIKITEHLIDCDASPYVLECWFVEEHKKGGSFKFDPNKISLYLSPNQKKGDITGGNLYQELSDKEVMNANVLDYLLVYPKIIPKKWKGKYIFFWGTIYRDSGDYRYVRFLYWDISRWDWGCRHFEQNFNSCCPVAILS